MHEWRCPFAVPSVEASGEIIIVLPARYVGFVGSGGSEIIVCFGLYYAFFGHYRCPAFRAVIRVYKNLPRLYRIVSVV